MGNQLINSIDILCVIMSRNTDGQPDRQRETQTLLHKTGIFRCVSGNKMWLEECLPQLSS